VPVGKDHTRFIDEEPRTLHPLFRYLLNPTE
jgi:hypothetical protein